MKVGDKVYCIKSLTINKIKYFIKNKTYAIITAFPDDDEISIESSVKTEYLDNVCFYFNPSHPEFNKHYFQDHFITGNQLRKRKLENLNK